MWRETSPNALAINGFVRDTGNHYLVVDRAIGEIVAPTVEAEIIAWLQKTGGAMEIDEVRLKALARLAQSTTEAAKAALRTELDEAAAT